jgi:SAM-dependent methyltransferase
VVDLWSAGEGYEPYIGRWSRVVAQQFVPWVGADTGSRWLDVGSGTGALTATVLATADPMSVLGVEPSEAFRRYAEEHVSDRRAEFREGDATALPVDDEEFDVAVAGLVLNFVPRPEAALAEMRRATRHGGRVAAYVWDYTGGMELIHRFWDAAGELDPDARSLDEGTRFPLCAPEPLRALFEDAGLEDVHHEALDIPTVFADFDDYWTPFLGGQGPAPGYLAQRTPDQRKAVRESLRERLPSEPDGSIRLTARAWAVQGSRPR